MGKRAELKPLKLTATLAVSITATEGGSSLYSAFNDASISEKFLLVENNRCAAHRISGAYDEKYYKNYRKYFS